jgi:PspAA-like protein
MNRAKSVKKGTRNTKGKLSSEKRKPLKNVIKPNQKKKKTERKLKMSRTKSAAIKTTTVLKPVRKNKIVRIMGEGQFVVDNKTLKKLNDIDNSLVQLVSNDRSDDTEFKKRLVELVNIVEQNGKQLDSKQIIQSDIILPSADLSIDEAKKLFKSDGVIPEI